MSAARGWRTPGAAIRRNLARLRRRDCSISILLGLVILAALLPVLLLGAYGVSRFARAQHEAEVTRVTDVAETLANAVNRELRGYIDTAEVLAGSQYLLKSNLAVFNDLARDVAARTGGDFIVIDGSGQQLINTRLPISAPLPRTVSEAEVRRVIETRRVAVTDLVIGAGSKTWSFAVLVPVTGEGDVSYVLAFVPRTDTIFDIVQQTYRPEGWFASILDRQGRIVARSARHSEFFGQSASEALKTRLTDTSGLLETVDLEGRPAVTAYNTVPASGWRVVAWAPKEVIQAPARRAVQLMLAITLLTLAVSIGAAILTGRLIQRPARSLVAGARALGEGRPVHVRPTAMREANFVARALADAARTIAQREQALRESEEQTRFVMRELTHRSKNLLAIVQAVARQTSRTTSDITEFQKRFGARLTSLARSHDLLLQRNWVGIAITELVTTQLAPFVDRAENRVVAKGPSLMLRPEAAETIGMALHELATNASKYGALSSSSGRVDVAWERRSDADGQASLHMRWEETCGRPVVPPGHNGFGRIVVEQMVATSLEGDATLAWKPDGLVWTLTAPAGCLVE